MPPKKSCAERRGTGSVEKLKTGWCNPTRNLTAEVMREDLEGLTMQELVLFFQTVINPWSEQLGRVNVEKVTKKSWTKPDICDKIMKALIAMPEILDNHKICDFLFPSVHPHEAATVIASATNTLSQPPQIFSNKFSVGERVWMKSKNMTGIILEVTQPGDFFAVYKEGGYGVLAENGTRDAYRENELEKWTTNRSQAGPSSSSVNVPTSSRTFIPSSSSSSSSSTVPVSEKIRLPRNVEIQYSVPIATAESQGFSRILSVLYKKSDPQEGTLQRGSDALWVLLFNPLTQQFASIYGPRAKVMNGTVTFSVLPSTTTQSKIVSEKMKKYVDNGPEVEAAVSRLQAYHYHF